jgi:hypothetical protein
MITCGWCQTHYNQWQSNCSNCGGPLPPPPGMDAGPEPPPPPRLLPRHFEFRQKWSRNVAVLAALGFMLISGLFLWAAIKAKSWMALVPGLFLLMGLSLFRYGRNTAVATLHAFHNGVSAEGKIAQLSLDTTQSVNGRHPWRLVYHFAVDGQQREGVITSFNSTLGERSTGQPLWVLYVKDDPEQNTIYPPVV